MIEKITIKFVGNDFIYEIPIEKIEEFCKSGTIEDIKQAITEAIKRI